MPDREYWRKRYLKDKARAVNAAEDFIRKDTKKYYMQAAKEIQADIEKFYKKYAAENGITLSEAKRRISQADFDGIDWEQLCRNESELNRELKKKKDSLPGDVVARMERERMEYENKIKTLSAKGNITRMELLQAEIDKAVLELYDAQQINIFDLLRGEYEDGYYRGMYSTQQCMGFGYNFAAVNTRAVEKAVLNPHRSNYSSAIYKHQKNLKKELAECLTVGMIKGEGIDKTIGRVQRRLEVSHSNARRLVRTETAYIYEQAMLDVYTECGITEYEYLATLDKKTSKICQELDGKRFKIADALPGTNYPPMHPNCRSTTVAAFDDDVATRRAARDDAGKYYTVPSDMTYKEWQRKHTDMTHTLTSKERHAVNQYLSFEAYSLNNKLRNGSKLNDREKSMMECLDSALDKLNDYKGNVMRAVDIRDENQLRAFLDRHQKGSEVEYSEYISTSNKEGYNPDANINIYINSKKGKNITSLNPAESEVLYTRNSRFLVVDIVNQEGKIYILMEECDG